MKGIATTMFKKAKSGSSFKSGSLSSDAAAKKEILEGLGYAFDSASKKSGWSWSTPSTRSDQNQPTEGDAVADAWRDAGERTCAAMKIPDETWERMGAREQGELLEEALAGG